MAAQLLAGLAKSVVKSGTKKLAVKKVKSFARDKTKEKVKGKLSKKSQILSSESDQQEKKLKISSMDGGVTSIPAGTMDSVKISPASDSKSQIEQLKINVTNIHSFLVKSNKQYKKQEADTRRNDKVQKSKSKLGGEEKRLEKGSSPLGKSMSKIKDAVSSTGGIFERIMNFVGLLLLGIAVNALPAIIEKVKEIVDNIVNFLTPIQSGFKVIMSFFTGDINEDELNVDKKRFDDGIQKITGKDGLFDQIKKKMGPFGFLIDLLRPAIDKIREALGLKNAAQKITLAKKGGKEGFVDVETGKFTEKQFTSEERERYEGERDQEGGDPRGGTVSKLGSGNATLNSLTDQQFSDLAYAVSGEAQPNSDDEYGVAANILTRLADPGYPNTIMGVFTAPGQYAAYEDGGARRDSQLANHLKANKDKIAEAIEKLNGRTDFKGTSQYGNMGEGDIKFSDRGNFYHYASQRGKNDPAPSNPPTYWKKLISSKKNTTIFSAALSSSENKNNQIVSINQPTDDEIFQTLFIQQVNTIQTAYVPMPIPMKSRSMGSTSSPTLSPIWSA